MTKIQIINFWSPYTLNIPPEVVVASKLVCQTPTSVSDLLDAVVEFQPVDVVLVLLKSSYLSSFLKILAEMTKTSDACFSDQIKDQIVISIV